MALPLLGSAPLLLHPLCADVCAGDLRWLLGRLL
jgi:hypothetical protein